MRALRRLGWTVLRIHGSHHVLGHADGRTMVLPIHRGRPLKEGTIRGILKHAGLSEDEFLSES